MPISTVQILKYVQQCYVKWFWTICSLGAPGLCCCIVWPLFLFDCFVKIWPIFNNFLGKWSTAPPGRKLPVRLCSSLTRSQQNSRGNNCCTARSIHEVPTRNFAAWMTPSPWQDCDNATCTLRVEAVLRLYLPPILVSLGSKKWIGCLFCEILEI